MKTYEVIGIEQVNYTSRKTNRQVEGVKLHLTYPFDEEDADGTGVEVVFTSHEVGDKVEIGDLVELLYNKFGSICDIRKA